MADRTARDAELYQHMRRCQLSNHKLDFSHFNERGEVCVDPSISSPSTKARKRSVKAALGDEAIRHRLDRILAIPGLQYGMMLGTFHEIKAMKCNQEVVHYLQHILDTWQNLMPKNSAAIHKLDLATVEALELKCPKHSVHDRERLELLMSSGQILQAFTVQERQVIYQNVLANDCILPSLRSFFADFRYLEHCAKCFCHLVDISGSMKQTINATLGECFQPEGHGRFEIQTGESSFVLKSGSPELQFDLGRKQIWLFIMRRCLRRVPPKRKSKGRFANAAPQILESGELRELASLALRQGFCNDNIKSLAGVTQEQTSSVYEDVLESDVSVPNQPENNTSISQRDGLRAPRDDHIWKDTETSRRSGWPYAAEHVRDQPYMFLNVLTDPSAPVSGVTSLFVRRCVFDAFFGRKICGYEMTASSDETAESHRRTCCYSPGSSLAMRSAELALVRRVSACVTEELDVSQVTSEQALIRHESMSRGMTSRTSSESRLRLGEPWITFISRENNEWRSVSQFARGDSLGVEQAAETFMTNGLRPFTVTKSRMQPIFSHECFDAALSSPTQTIILIPENKAHITSELISSAEGLRFGSESPGRESRHSPGPSASSVYST